MVSNTMEKLQQLAAVSGPIKYFQGEMIYKPQGSNGASGTYTFIDYGNGTATLYLEMKEPESGEVEYFYIRIPMRFSYKFNVPGSILRNISDNHLPFVPASLEHCFETDLSLLLYLPEPVTCEGKALQCSFQFNTLPQLQLYRFDLGNVPAQNSPWMSQITS